MAGLNWLINQQIRAELPVHPNITKRALIRDARAAYPGVPVNAALYRYLTRPRYAELVVADGATNYWRLGETSGTTAVDQIGGANGTISGGVTLNQPGALADGNPAMLFNGTTGKIVTAASVPIPAAATIEVWLKTLYAGPQISFVSTRSQPGATGSVVFLGIQSGVPGKELIIVSGGSLAGLTHMADGQWHHVVLVFTGSTAAWFVDGVLDNSGSLARASAAGALSIGWDLPNGQFWPGSLDDVAIYPLALTPAQILAHYEARL